MTISRQRQYMDCKYCNAVTGHTNRAGCILAVQAAQDANEGWDNLLAQAAENEATRPHYEVVKVGLTNIILCWIYGSDRYTDPPDEYLGPYMHEQALEIAKTLTCTYTIRVLQATPSEWATRS